MARSSVAKPGTGAPPAGGRAGKTEAPEVGMLKLVLGQVVTMENGVYRRMQAYARVGH